MHEYVLWVVCEQPSVPYTHTSVFATTLCLMSFRKNISGKTKEDNSSLNHNQIYIHTLSATRGKGYILLLVPISSLLQN